MFKRLFDRLSLARLRYRAVRRLAELERAGQAGKATTFRAMLERADALAARENTAALLAECALVAALFDGVTPVERLLLAGGLQYSVRARRLKIVVTSLVADRTRELLNALRAAGML